MKNETILAVDLGGTKILVGEVDSQGQILNSQRFPTDVSSQENALAQLRKSIHAYLAQGKTQGVLVALSIAVVGRVDSQRGIWYEIHPGNAQEIPVTELLAQEFNLPVFLSNDVTSAAYAENSIGIGRQTEDFVYLNIGTGIAGRVVSQGTLIAGGHFNAGEIGHMVVDLYHPVICLCGRKGCVESFASGLGMSREAQRLKETVPTTLVIGEGRVATEDLLAAYQKQDPLATEVVLAAARGIAELIMNCVRFSDPEAVILGGGVMSSPVFYDLVMSQMNQKTIRFVTYGIQQTSIDPRYIALVGCGLRGFHFIKQEVRQVG